MTIINIKVSKHIHSDLILVMLSLVCFLILSIYQLRILPRRTAQISLELCRTAH